MWSLATLEDQGHDVTRGSDGNTQLSGGTTERKCCIQIDRANRIYELPAGHPASFN